MIFLEKILRKKFVTFSNADFLDEHHFILKNNFSIKTQSFREMISNYLEENVNFQFGVEIKKIKFKAQKYRLFDQDRLITKADAVIYSGGFKSSESVLENSKILKPSIGQQDYIKSFDNFSMPYLGDMYLNKLNAKKFIIGALIMMVLLTIDFRIVIHKYC